MPYTSHGHPYGIIDSSQQRPATRVRCGGPDVCPICNDEVARYDEVGEAYRRGYLDGRMQVAEEIAQAMEREFTTSARIPAWAASGGVLTAESIQGWAAGIARNFKE